MRSARVRVFGAEDLERSVTALGLEVTVDGPDVALIDLDDAAAVGLASVIPRELPRLFVAGDRQRVLLSALAVDPSCVATGREPAALGPALLGLLPSSRPTRTRVAVVTGVRGGVGATLLVTNIARRVAPALRVCVVDATGSGAAAWWLSAQPAVWPDLEALIDEMSPDHIGVIGHEVRDGLRVIGGASSAPSHALLAATVRAAAIVDDLVVVDAPRLCHHAVRALGERCVVLSYDDPISMASLDAYAIAETDWLVVSQSRATHLGQRRVFRALPRDEDAVASAMRSRHAVAGALGRAYDDLAELIRIDAS